MKKSLLFLTFACFLFAGSQLSFAQTKAEQETLSSKTQSTAEENANKVINMFARSKTLDADQKTKILDVFVGVDKKLKNIEALKEAQGKQAKKAKMQEYINQKIKQILTEDQYALYMKNMTPH